jgi:hypothetical protein
MGKKDYYGFFIIVILLSCKQHTSQSINKIDNPAVDSSLNIISKNTDTLNKINYVNKNLMQVKDSTFSCHELLLLLVKSSSFDPEMKRLRFDIRIDEVVKGVATLELTIKNEERNEDVALSWLEMDFNKKELRDVTVDPDKPIQLKYDSSLFRKVVENCKFPGYP